MGPDVMILVFWILSFKPAFSVSSFTFIKRLFSSSSLSALEWHHPHIWGYWYFSQQSWFQLVLHPAWHFTWYILHMGFPGGSDGKVSGYNAGDPGSGRSPGEGNGNPLQYSCLENSMDGGAWCATVHGVTKSRTRLSDFTTGLPYCYLDWNINSLFFPRVVLILMREYQPCPTIL